MELSEYLLETLCEDGEFILYRGQHHSRIGEVLPPVLVVAPVSERPALRSLQRIEHEYALRAELDPGWAVRPFALAPHQGRTMLVLTDPGGEPLDRLLGRPMESAPFFCAAPLASRPRSATYTDGGSSIRTSSWPMCSCTPRRARPG